MFAWPLRVPSFVFLGAFAGLVASAPAQPAQQGDLFIAAETENRAAPATEPDAGVLRARFVQVDSSLLETARLNTGRLDATPTLLRLGLFDDVVLAAAVERSGPTSAGYWLWGTVTAPFSGELTVVSAVAGKSVILDGTSTTTCRGCMSEHRRQEPVWTSVRGAGVKAVSPAERGRSEATRLDVGEHTRTLLA